MIARVRECHAGEAFSGGRHRFVTDARARGARMPRSEALSLQLEILLAGFSLPPLRGAAAA